MRASGSVGINIITNHVQLSGIGIGCCCKCRGPTANHVNISTLSLEYWYKADVKEKEGLVYENRALKE